MPDRTEHNPMNSKLLYPEIMDVEKGMCTERSREKKMREKDTIRHPIPSDRLQTLFLSVFPINQLRCSTLFRVVKDHPRHYSWNSVS